MTHSDARPYQKIQCKLNRMLEPHCDPPEPLSSGPGQDRAIRLIAFYLPQYHPIPENDRWWGKGFTDWVNVRRASPIFPGHLQPRIPTELGYYDLRNPEARARQATLAEEHGISAFCYYHYWFGGKRLLHEPFEAVLSSGQPSMPFCLCWANENWTRRWDGRESEILLAQEYDPSSDQRFIEDLLPALADSRYVRVGGRPLLLVHRAQNLPDPLRTTDSWRRAAHQAGIGDLLLAFVETAQNMDCPVPGFDSMVEFPPLANVSGSFLAADQFAANGIDVAAPDFRGWLLDYERMATAYLDRSVPAGPLFRSVMPAWDNSARRGNSAAIFVHSSPRSYRRWLERAARRTIAERSGDDRIVFVNAWNEWAEGCYLEPDLRYGRAFLEATREVIDNLGLFPEPTVLSNPDSAYSIKTSSEEATSTTQLRMWLDAMELRVERLCARDRENPTSDPAVGALHGHLAEAQEALERLETDRNNLAALRDEWVDEKYALISSLEECREELEKIRRSRMWALWATSFTMRHLPSRIWRRIEMVSQSIVLKIKKKRLG